MSETSEGRRQDEMTDASEDSHLDIEAQAKFDDLKRRAAGLEGTIESHIEAAEKEARDRAEAIVAQAEREAEEIRADTQMAVDDARARVNELMRLRQALFATLRETLGDFESAIALSEEARTFTDAAAPQPAQTAKGIAQPVSSEEESNDITTPPEAEQSREPAQSIEPQDQTETLLEPDEPVEPRSEAGYAETAPMGPVVKVEVGPLRDYEAVNAVERAFSALPGTHDVYLRSFDDGVAVLEAFGMNVNMLLSSMRASFTIPFILRSANAGRLVLQVDESAPHREDL